MKTSIKLIGIVALLLGVSGSALAQDFTAADMVQAIRTATPQDLYATMERGEMVECFECIPMLERMLLESDVATNREIAAWWLRKRLFGFGPVYVRTRDALTSDPDPVRRARAAEALGEFLDHHALVPLADAVRNDASDVVRTAAVSALGRLNHPGGNVTIAAAMTDPSVDVRRAAMTAVRTVNFFREYDALLSGLADDDTAVRRRAVLLVGQHRVEAAAPALAGLLRGDADPDVRQSSAWALGRLATAEARAALNETLGTETVSLVRDAIEVALRMRR